MPQRVIWKFPIPAEPMFTIDMPEGRPKVLDVQMQGDTAVMWAIVDPAQRIVKHRFAVLATGVVFEREAFDPLEYVGTFQPRVDLAFHLFEMI